MAQETFLDPPTPDIMKQWQFYFSVLHPASGDTVIDVGCSTGDVERFLLREYPDIGKIVGVEASQSRYDRAVEKWRKDGEPNRIEFKLADGRKLPFSDDCFDKAFCAETLEWIDPPIQALREIYRVLKPKGPAVIIHTDFDTQVFNTQDKKLSRKVVMAFSDAGPNGQIGRELYGLCRKAGFQTVEPIIYTLTNTDWQANLYAYKITQMMTDWLRSKALLSESEIESWLADIESQAREDSFFYSVNRYMCRCLK